MRRTILFAFLSAALLAIGPTDTKAQKKNQKNQNQVASELATDQDYKWLQSIKEMTGTLAGVNTFAITFRLDTPQMEPNPKYKPPKATNAQHQQLNNIYRQQAQVMKTKDPIQRQLRMQQLLMSMGAAQYQQMLQAAAAGSNPNNLPFQLAHQYKDFDLDLAENVSLRKMSLGTEYDDKGNLKTYTQEEKDKLRGKDLSKPGYKAKIDDLQTGQTVKVQLKMPKKSKAASELDEKEDKTAKDKDKDKDKADDKVDPPPASAKKADKGDDKAKGDVVKPIVTMVVILSSPDAVAEATPPKKKKDK